MTGLKQKYPRSFCRFDYRMGFSSPIVEVLGCHIDRLWEEAELERPLRLFFMSQYSNMFEASHALCRLSELPETLLRPETPLVPPDVGRDGDYRKKQRLAEEYAAGYILRLEAHVDRLLLKYFGASVHDV